MAELINTGVVCAVAFPVLKECAVLTLDGQPFDAGRVGQEWMSLTKTVAKSCPPEPFTGLVPSSKENISEILDHLHRENVKFFVSKHEDTLSDIGLCACVAAEAAFFDANQQNPAILSGNGLKRVIDLRDLRPNTLHSLTKPALQNANFRRSSIGERRGKRHAFVSITDYGKVYKEYVEAKFSHQLK